MDAHISAGELADIAVAGIVVRIFGAVVYRVAGHSVAGIDTGTVRTGAIVG